MHKRMTEDYKAFDVVYADLGTEEFAGEQGGKRPVLIIQNDRGNKNSKSTIVLPFTTKLKNLYMPTHSLFEPCEENGLEKTSMLLGECVRQISEQRIIRKLGEIIDIDDRFKVKKIYQANFAWDALEG